MAGLQPRAYTAMKPSPFKGVVWPHVTACQLADAALVVPLPSLAAWSNRVANSPRAEVHDLPQSSVAQHRLGQYLLRAIRADLHEACHALP